MAIGTGQFKKGKKILINDEPYSIIDFEHYKPGKGNQFTRTKLKNLVTGQNIDKTIKSGEKFDVPDITYTDMVYLYKTENDFVFMNNDTYEQIHLAKSVVKKDAFFLKENMVVSICIFNSQPINLSLPTSVTLEVTHTEPGVKGDTVSGANKPVTMETGLTLQAPLHIQEGDRLKINVKTGQYVERVNK